ncbi:ion channel [Streptomyces sp. NPDC050738]|uniref:ion channel n=1 Tax=Streptomyces sp. NPDC050738 TaxID=3154744 RepID=UPI003415E6E9
MRPRTTWWSRARYEHRTLSPWPDRACPSSWWPRPPRHSAEERGAPGAITALSDALWWALATATTVGHGDLTPVTASGRAFGAVLMVVGIGVMGTVTAAISAELIRPVADKPVTDPLQQLTRLAGLHKQGALTDEEFLTEKTDLLARV